MPYTSDDALHQGKCMGASGKWIYDWPKHCLGGGELNMWLVGGIIGVGE